ncbi:hypothetical protein [Candidatus Phytoplasma ziziphi]|uniref:hypothetical protein n=1 Tax=Ziziphus jujuba witches'-broom phytoplasma TaxID=135727 RepID=UPI00126030C9|nr:hypothetical protein [Candidatus Phytoplasma ziziphi]
MKKQEKNMKKETKEEQTTTKQKYNVVRSSIIIIILLSLLYISGYFGKKMVRSQLRNRKTRCLNIIFLYIKTKNSPSSLAHSYYCSLWVNNLIKF